MHLLKKGDKVEMVPLVREEREGSTDPQYNGLLPILKYVVFYDYGDGTLGAVYFIQESKAWKWIEERQLLAAEAAQNEEGIG